MRSARKFLFETSFDDDEEEEAGIEPEVEEPEVPEEPAITPEDLAAARSEGFAAGYTAGAEEERNATGRMHAMAAEALVARIAEIDGALQAVCEAGPRQGVALALAVLRRILPGYVRREGTREIESLLRECLRELIDEPRLVLRVGETSFDAINGILTPLTSRAGFSGRVVLLADEGLGESDCLVEWADGGAERNVGRTWREIDQTVTRILSMSQPATSGEEADAAGETLPAAGAQGAETGGYSA